MLGFYGKYFILLKENANLNLKQVLEQKPGALDGIQEGIESLATKLIDKGLQKHTIV